MSHDDFAVEAVRGLPAALPEGETLLWQGTPDWKSLAVNTYYVRMVALYFGALLLWRFAAASGEFHGLGAVLRAGAVLTGLGAFTVGALALLSYLSARTTVYSITSARVVLRHGIAMPLTVNIPFSLLEAADLRLRKNGTGDIALRLLPGQRIGYLITWPHVRPGFLVRPQPSFRSVPAAEHAAKVLGDAILAQAGANAVRVESGAAGTPAARPRTAAAA